MQPLPTVPKAELSRYAGKWNEVARLAFFFQRGCTHSTTEYGLKSDGTVSVINGCLKRGNPRQVQMTGDKTLEGFLLRGVKKLNAQGFCVASVDYRLCKKTGETKIRDCVTDSKDALRFLAKNAKQFSLDADRVFTFGDSAGGHLAQMVLLSPPESFPGDSALADAKYHLVAGVSWYGPCDFEKTELFNPGDRANFRDRFGRRILQNDADPQTKVAAYREVSPVNYLKPDSPPLLMVQGDMDTTIPCITRTT